MYAVIFKANIRQFDQTYSQMATRLRERAINEYGCLEFTACTEGDAEIAISYWPTLEHIQRWKQDALHQEAQQLAKSQWYTDYQVQIVEVLREYGAP